MPTPSPASENRAVDRRWLAEDEGAWDLSLSPTRQDALPLSLVERAKHRAKLRGGAGTADHPHHRDDPQLKTGVALVAAPRTRLLHLADDNLTVGPVRGDTASPSSGLGGHSRGGSAERRGGAEAKMRQLEQRQQRSRSPPDLRMDSSLPLKSGSAVAWPGPSARSPPPFVLSPNTVAGRSRTPSPEKSRSLAPPNQTENHGPTGGQGGEVAAKPAKQVENHY